jgi:orotidine-5'-phosphate decarboxylase
VAAHCRLVIEAAGEQCVAVKPQVACFERLGAPGWAALREVVADVRERGLIVIADGKRGDIDISARAYGQAFFGTTPTPFGDVPSLGVDALTVNPLLGRDSLGPLVDAARGQGGGLFVLTRTSNPGASDLQDRELRGGGAVSDAIAAIVDELGCDGRGRGGDRSGTGGPSGSGGRSGTGGPSGSGGRSGTGGRGGLADVGAVVGATAPEHLERLRSRMTAAVMLLPGLGPQGGSGRDLAPAFAPGPAGGLVSASRAIVYAFEQGGGDPAAAARAEARRLRELVWGQYS